MIDLIAAVPSLPYTQLESVNLRGYPAIHAIGKSELTLCGKNPEGWNVLGMLLKDVNCKVCLRIMERLNDE